MTNETYKSESPSVVLPPNTQRILIFVIVVAAVVYLILSLRAGFAEVMRAIQEIGGVALLGMLATSLSSYSLGFLRWQTYLNLLD